MGYYTRFRARVLAVDGKTDKIEEFESLTAFALKVHGYGDEELKYFKDEYAREISEAQKTFSGANHDIFNLFMQALHRNLSEAKWYDHEEDLRALSRFFPAYILELSGEGENNEDVWTKWFHRGQMQGGKAQIILPTLDLKKWGL